MKAGDFIAAIKKCRQCGNEFEACRQTIVNQSINWKSILCSEACRKLYEEAILVSRGIEPGLAKLFADCDEGKILPDKKNKKNVSKQTEQKTIDGIEFVFDTPIEIKDTENIEERE